MEEDLTMGSQAKVLKRTREGIRIGIIVLSLLTVFNFVSTWAVATSPVISTTWTISNGAVSPVVYLNGTDFSPASNKFDFTVNVGSTGLGYDSVAYIDSTHMRFNFHETAKAGTITIQANATAFSPLASEASNVVTLVVPVPLTPQTIIFTTPSEMVAKDPDQNPKVNSTSGLIVTLTSNTPSACTIDFLKFHAVAAGACSITATQTGNSEFAPAAPVTKTFTVSALPSVTPVVPNNPESVVTDLGSYSYNPNNSSGGYVSVLVEGENSDPKKAVLVKLLIPKGATDVPVVFLISAFSPDQETSAGYFVVRTKMINQDGKSISRLKSRIEINIPAGAIEGIPSWSLDGISWHTLGRLESEVIRADVHAGYFMEKDGRIAIFSDYLMLFGFRKAQAPLTITPPSIFIKAGDQKQILSTGGSGTGDLNFFSHTPDVCVISPAGVLIGLSEGKCIIAAHKDSSGIYANAISPVATIFIQHESMAAGHPASDPNHSTLCQEISYTLLKSSTLIYVDLCAEEAFKKATLEVGTKSATGTWIYKVAANQNLDKKGVAIFKLNSVLKIGQVVRIKAEGRLQISVVIELR